MILIVTVCIILVTSCHQVESKVITVNNNGQNTSDCCVDGKCPCSSLFSSIQHITDSTIVNIISESVELHNITTLHSTSDITITSNKTIVKCNNTGSASFVNTTNITIHGITWDQCGDPNDPHVDGGISFATITTLTIDNCSFQNSQICAVSLSSVSGDITIKDSYFISNGLRNTIGPGEGNCGGLKINNNVAGTTVAIVISDSVFSGNGRFIDRQYYIIYGVFIEVSELNITLAINRTKIMSNFGGMYLKTEVTTFPTFILSEVNVSDNINEGVRLSRLQVAKGDINLMILNSIFSNNSNGGLIGYIFGLTANKINVTIENTNFTDNRAVNFSNSALSIAVSSANATSLSVYVQYSKFINNKNGSIRISTSEGTVPHLVYFYEVIIKECVAMSSSSGSGIVSISLQSSLSNTYFFQSVFFISNKYLGNTGGALFLSTSNADNDVFIEDCVFQYNSGLGQGAALYVADGVMSNLYVYQTIIQCKDVIFTSNIAAHSVVYFEGGIFNSTQVAIEDTHFTNNIGNGLHLFMSQLTFYGCMIFENNTANSGAALYLEQGSQVYFGDKYAPVIILFSNNTATCYGGAIYADLPSTCPNKGVMFHTFSWNLNISFMNNKAGIIGNSMYFNVHEFREVNTNVNNSNSLLYLPYKFNYSETLNTSIVTSPHSVVLYFENYDKQITEQLIIELSTCPPGYKHSSYCICYDHKDIIVKCYEIEIKKGYWFGMGIDPSKPTVSLCPGRYCYFGKHRKKTWQGYYLLPSKLDDQCHSHRTGVACGECKPGYTLAYDSPDCINTDKCSAGMTVLVIVLTIVYWIAVVAIVFVLMHFSCKFQIPLGYAYGIIYFYNVVDILLDNNPYISDRAFQFITALSCFGKLTPQLFRQLCLVEGLSGIDQQFIHYTHALGVSLILLIIVKAARYSPRLAFYVHRYILRVICILLLLSYTSLASTSLQLLRATCYPGYDGLYVYVSPDMKYFNDRHAFYGAVALLCGAIVVIGLPLFLLLEPLILSRWFNFVKVMPLLNQFQSCYKNNCRWFAAYYLICRQVIIIIVYFGNNDYYQMLFYLQAACIFIQMVHIVIQPYTKNSLNIFDTFILYTLYIVMGCTSLSHIDTIQQGEIIITVIFIITAVTGFVVISLLVVVVIRRKRQQHSLFLKSDFDGDRDSKADYGRSYVIQALQIRKGTEICPLRNSQNISKIFDCSGGELFIKEHAVKVTVPVGAIDENYEVEIQAAASLFGPFIIPEDYYPISAYVWIGACYKFKKKIIVEMEHDIVVSEETNISELCVLTACKEDKCDGENNQILYKMHKDTCEYHYELNKSTCTIFTSHFCSKCLAAKGKAKKARRIMMYHYLPEDYKSQYEFVAEVCFCYDLTFCTERTEERYFERKMQQVFSTFIRIFNWKKDKIIILYDHDQLDNWEIHHIGVNKIEAVALDFRWYKSVDKLLRDEENDLFPPRFRLKMINKDYHLSTRNLVYTYNICIQSKRKKDEYLALNISGFGQQIVNKKVIEQSDEYHTNANEKQSHEQTLKQQSISPCGQQSVDQDQMATSQTESQDSQEQALATHLSCFGNPQQLKSALQTTDRTTNVTYIFAKGDNNTISLPSSDDSPAVKTKFNSLQPFTDKIAGSVNVDVILPMMIQEGLVTVVQQQDLINPLHSAAAKQQKLCSIILGLPEGCVKKFLHCLLKTNNYEPHRQLYDELYKHIQVTEL